MYCQQCGQTFTAQTAYCQHCGAPAPTNQAANQTPPVATPTPQAPSASPPPMPQAAEPPPPPYQPFPTQPAGGQKNSKLIIWIVAGLAAILLITAVVTLLLVLNNDDSQPSSSDKETTQTTDQTADADQDEPDSSPSPATDDEAGSTSGSDSSGAGDPPPTDTGDSTPDNLGVNHPTGSDMLPPLPIEAEYEYLDGYNIRPSERFEDTTQCWSISYEIAYKGTWDTDSLEEIFETETIFNTLKSQLQALYPEEDASAGITMYFNVFEYEAGKTARDYLDNYADGELLFQSTCDY